MGNPKDIFKSHSILTEKEISDYLSGNLSEAQKRKIELKISQDEFNADALEGIVANPGAMTGYESARESVLKNIDKKSGGWQFHHTMILAIVAVVAMMVIGSKIFPESGNVQVVQTTQEKDTAVNELNPVPIAVDEISDEEIEEAIELPEIHLVKAKEVIAASPVVLDTLVMDNTTEPNMTFD